MAVLRTVCPHCDVVRVPAEATVLRHLDDDQIEIDFSCPECRGRIVQQLHDRMAPLLLSAGCLLDPLIDPSAMTAPDVGGITEAEIQEFVQALDRSDWAEQLVL